jgi:hypothetical protein
MITKIAIVGPELSKWKSEQIPKVKAEIFSLLKRHAIKSFDVIDEHTFTDYDYSNIVVVSGHCPRGKERKYCVNCDEWYPEYPNVMMESQWEIKHANHMKIEVYDEGGVDTWAEMKATELGIKKEIYPAEVNQWGNSFQCRICGVTFDKPSLVTKHGNMVHNLDYKTIEPIITLRGFRSRNIQTVKACDVLYCIVPKVKLPKGFDITKPETLSKEFACYHCHKVGHPTNGGCWTKKYADEHGKETHLIVID